MTVPTDLRTQQPYHGLTARAADQQVPAVLPMALPEQLPSLLQMMPFIIGTILNIDGGMAANNAMPLLGWILRRPS